MRQLRFVGDWPLLLGATVALLLAVAAYLYYRRETRGRQGPHARLLPLLRSLEVILLVMMLTGPVLHHRWIVGRLARILVFVDTSRSMGVTDQAMGPGRKILNAVELGLLGEDVLPDDLVAAQKALARTPAWKLSADASSQDRRTLAEQLLQTVQAAREHLAKAHFEPGMLQKIEKGTILYQQFQGVAGNDPSAIERHADFPDKPSSSQTLKQCQGPVDTGDNYVGRIAGFLYPPQTGDYVFWLASDDNGWLFLSTDDNPVNKRLIARVTGWAPPQGWDQAAAQKSEPIALAAGQRYYIEALHVEQSGGDHVGVGWQLPGGAKERPIPGEHLSAWTAPQPGRPQLTSKQAALEQFDADLVGPAQQLAQQDAVRDHAAFASRYFELTAKVGFWDTQLRLSLDQWAAKLLRSGADEVVGAVQSLDGLTRLDRVRRILLEGDSPLLAELAADHHIDLIAFSDTGVESIFSSLAGQWDRRQGSSELLPAPVAQATNVALPLTTTVGVSQEPTHSDSEQDAENRLAAVVFSDGRHNYGPSPIQSAKMCGGRNVPVYTVAVGSLNKPADIALEGIEAPTSVYHKDRVRGRIYFQDQIPAGRPFTLKILHDKRVLWEETLQTTNAGRRSIEYDFPVEEILTEALQGHDRRLQYQSYGLVFTATVTDVQGLDAEPANNSRTFRTRAIFRRNRILILDGRPRWEFRYVRNLLQRDEKWEVTALLADPTAADGGIRRGQEGDVFPSRPDALFEYGLILLGDFPARYLKTDEMQWIRDAVARRGLGLILVDGLRKHLRDYVRTPLAELLPVQWNREEPIRSPQSLRLTDKGVLRLTEQGTDMAALVLTSGDKTNAEIWASLAPPHWLADVATLGGAEVLVEAVLSDRRVPAIAYRRFGAGKVLFAAFDETWRWRYRVADEYHQRYWNQMGNLIMAPPFAVSDRFVSLDAGPLVYAPDQIAQIRALIRNEKGDLTTEVTVEAVLSRDGQVIASIPLVVDEQSGQYRGETAKLPPGDYDVRVRIPGYPPDQMLAAAQFHVEKPQAGELAKLDCDRPLLEQIASLSGGEFLLEEDARRLTDRLKMLSQGKVMERDTALWQSGWWFAIIIALFTIEWILRKRAGML